MIQSRVIGTRLLPNRFLLHQQHELRRANEKEIPHLTEHSLASKIASQQSNKHNSSFLHHYTYIYTHRERRRLEFWGRGKSAMEASQGGGGGGSERGTTATPTPSATPIAAVASFWKGTTALFHFSCQLQLCNYRLLAVNCGKFTLKHSWMEKKLHF